MPPVIQPNLSFDFFAFWQVAVCLVSDFTLRSVLQNDTAFVEFLRRNFSVSQDEAKRILDFRIDSSKVPSYLCKLLNFR